MSSIAGVDCPLAHQVQRQRAVELMGLPRGIYHLVMTNIAMENHPSIEVLIGKSSINGPFSMAMLNNQGVLGIARKGVESLYRATSFHSRIFSV